MTETALNTQAIINNINGDISNKNISIIAIGGAGCQILKELAKDEVENH